MTLLVMHPMLLSFNRRRGITGSAIFVLGTLVKTTVLLKNSNLVALSSCTIEMTINTAAFFF